MIFRLIGTGTPGAWVRLRPRYFQNMKGDLIMETKNIIIANYGGALSNIVGNLNIAIAGLNDNPDENAATIKTINVLLESVRSQTVLLQQAVDSYGN